jgi:hypothetical protein
VIFGSLNIRPTYLVSIFRYENSNVIENSGNGVSGYSCGACHGNESLALAQRGKRDLASPGGAVGAAAMRAVRPGTMSMEERA